MCFPHKAHAGHTGTKSKQKTRRRPESLKKKKKKKKKQSRIADRPKEILLEREKKHEICVCQHRK
jgi:hypothetical protein